MIDVSDEADGGQAACSECGGPLGEDSYVFQGADGSLLPVCARCATAERDEGPASVEEHPAADDAQVDAALKLFDDVIQRRERETEDLRTLAVMLTDLARDSALWRDRAEGARESYRSLKAELERTRERLQATERLLAPGAPTEESGLPAQPAPSTAAITDATPTPGPLVTLDQVRAVQRIFNDTKFSDKLRSVARSLGKPLVCLAAVAGPETRVMITVVWDIVWYQYLVSLGPDVPPEEQVTAFAEGMEPSELTPAFRVSNAALDDSGRVDASEMEVGLLEEGTELLTNIPPDRAAAIDDATEEIWDQHAKPEFRWDD